MLPFTEDGLVRPDEQSVENDGTLTTLVRQDVSRLSATLNGYMLLSIISTYTAELNDWKKTSLTFLN